MGIPKLSEFLRSMAKFGDTFQAMKHAGLPCKIESGDSVVAVFLRAADWLDQQEREEREAVAHKGVRGHEVRHELQCNQPTAMTEVRFLVDSIDLNQINMLNACLKEIFGKAPFVSVGGVLKPSLVLVEKPK